MKYLSKLMLSNQDLEYLQIKDQIHLVYSSQNC